MLQTQNLSPASIWILQKYVELENRLEENLVTYELAHSVDGLYKFLWDFYADWYVEYIKTDPSQVPFAKDLFKQFIVTLNPYSPFETEALWQDFFGEKESLALVQKDVSWAKNIWSQIDQNRVGEFQTIVDFISDVRSLRGLFAIDPAVFLEVNSSTKLLSVYADFIKSSSRVHILDQEVEGLYEVASQNYIYKIDIIKYIPDFQKEIKRTEKILESLEKQIKALESQLQNESFLKNAEAEVIAEKRQDLRNRELEKTQQEQKLKYITSSILS
jgi:valyl-tRNA synthetase